MQNRITQAFQQKNADTKLLSIFFTAGYPKLNDTRTIIESLANAGADMIEIGMPFSDPVADGPTIQHSSEVALENGMSVKLLMEQLEGIRETVDIPLLLMGYLNPVMQYGIEAFCAKAAEVGIDGLILPDLPIDEYIESYKNTFDKYQLSNVLLITPQTSEERIRLIDEQTEGFIYMVSSDSTTGKTGEISESQKAYFERVQAMKLRNGLVIGFGISNHQTFTQATQYADGAIIGSAFIKQLNNANGQLSESITQFIRSVKEGE